LANELSSFTFRGKGNGRTAQFTLKSDAALRIIAEGGPFKLTVIKADGTPLPTGATQPDGGLGLMAIPDPGTYEMIIEASGRWGVTVVFQK
jgi:hypothetical protein